MKVLGADSYKVMPWKNGLGKTAEVAVFPPNASASDCLWRLSLAHVGASGPFSAFPGIERTIVQLSGLPMRLTHAHEKHFHTLRLLEPYIFAGEAETEADIAGAGTDFNVMVRRGAYRSSVSLLTMEKDGSVLLDAKREIVFLYCVSGGMRVLAQSLPAALVASPGDTVMVDDWKEGEGQFSLGGEGVTEVLLVRLMRLSIA